MLDTFMHICSFSTRVDVTRLKNVNAVSRDACISRVAMPSLRWVRATAREVICPCTSVASSSLPHKSLDKVQALQHDCTQIDAVVGMACMAGMVDNF